MAQRSRKIGKVTVSVRVDWQKHRQRLSSQRRENGFLEVTADRVDVDLDGLVSYVKGKGGCRLDCEEDLLIGVLPMKLVGQMKNSKLSGKSCRENEFQFNGLLSR